MSGGGTVKMVLLRSITFALLLFAAGCGGTVTAREGTIDMPAVSRAMASLRGVNTFFAHQSVGGNIVAGIASLERDAPEQALPLIDITKNPVLASTGDGSQRGFIAHAYLGKNGDPKGKTDAFAAAIEAGLGKGVDIAFQKYCFVDIDARTDVPALFNYYRDTMARLQGEFPKLALLHVTAPLVRLQSGPRATVKTLLGRTPDFYDDNAARERFNSLMRAEYAPRGVLFDLAALEAGRPGETPVPVQFQGKDFLGLRSEYTTDGSHLNEAAQKRVASEFLAFLSRVHSDGIAQAPSAPRP